MTDGRHAGRRDKIVLPSDRRRQPAGRPRRFSSEARDFLLQLLAIPQPNLLRGRDVDVQSIAYGRSSGPPATMIRPPLEPVQHLLRRCQSGID